MEITEDSDDKQAVNRRLFTAQSPSQSTTAHTQQQLSSWTCIGSTSEVISQSQRDELEKLRKEVRELEEKLARLPVEQLNKTKEIQRQIDEVFDKRVQRMRETKRREYERLKKEENDRTESILEDIAKQKVALLEKGIQESKKKT